MVRRLLLVIMALLVCSIFPADLVGQQRLPTEMDDSGRLAPSFRGGEKRGYEGAAPGYGVVAQPGMPTGEGGITQIAMGYQVHVLGEVRRPGTYKIPASGRLADAVQLAGGFADNGSERFIELKRKGRRVQTVDLLKFKLFGSLADNPYLLDNDVVFVPLRKNVIQVVGAVRRPQIYELRGEKDLSQVIELAGNFSAAVAKGEPVRVVRYVDGEKRVEEVRNDLKDLGDFRILSGDVIVVPDVVTKNTQFDYNVAAIPGEKVFYPSYEDRVFVLGGVRFPGAYPFSPYYTVSQYISLAGGLSEKGKGKYRIINAKGESHKVKENDRVNPGETIAVKERWMTPAGWAGFALGIASFGLSASATIIAVSR